MTGGGPPIGKIILLRGKSLLVDLYDCNEKLLQDVDRQYKLLVELPARIGMTIISAPQIARWDLPQAGNKEEWGYSGTILFAESHAYFHSWPEYRYVMWDLTSCKDFNHARVARNLGTQYGAKKVVPHVIQRGDEF